MQLSDYYCLIIFNFDLFKAILYDYEASVDALLKNGAIIDTEAKAKAKDSTPKVKEKLATVLLSRVS